MPKNRPLALPGGGSYIGHRGERRERRVSGERRVNDERRVGGSEPGLKQRASDRPRASAHRYVDVPCPSGKHQRSILTFRSHTLASMFCVPCEHGWTEPTINPALRDLAADNRR
jgi:hypothetical protein